MEYLKKLYKISFYAIILITFGIGGFLQLFIGVPNTLLSYIAIFIVLFFVLIYYFSKKIIIINKVVIAFLLFGLLIVFSSIVNGTVVLKTALYMLFFLLPLGVYLFFRINKKEGYLSQVYLNKLFFFIACVQLPLMVIQKYAYPLLVQINQSNQGIIEADIMFGSFFLKADHALGLFLLFNVFNILEKNKNKEITRYPFFMFLYLSATIFYSESNVTKLLLLIFVIYSIYRLVPKKLKTLGLVIAFAFSFFFIMQVKELEAVQAEIHFVSNEYNAKKSFRNFQRGIAKRPQVIITYATHFPLKIVGDGPYSYFDILKGKFKNTQHFSQIIWSYADLGIIGVILLIGILYRISKSIDVPKHQAVFVFFILLTYAFMTTVFGDIAMMIALFGVFKQKTQLSPKNNKLL